MDELKCSCSHCGSLAKWATNEVPYCETCREAFQLQTWIGNWERILSNEELREIRTRLQRMCNWLEIDY